MNIVGSPDISVLQANVTWDISGLNPVISLENKSVGSNLAGVTWWIVANAPDTTAIHEGSQSSPDITGDWSSHVITDSWPMPKYQIEWSGASYSLVLWAKDSQGNIFHSETYYASICRPNGNSSSSKNPYGVADADVVVKCQDGYVYFQDTTNHSYKGISGTMVNSLLRVIYPMDETYTLPDPFQITNFVTALVPVTYSNDNYQFVQTSVWEYDLGGGSFVRILYKQQRTFAVQCNIDLCPLVCEVTKLIDSIENGSCSDVDAAQNKLNLINPKLHLAMIGVTQPLCGVDVPKLIEEIKKIGGFTCDCCNTATGINAQNGSVIDGYNFQIVSVGGDVGGTVSKVGNNIQFNLFDKSYVFDVAQDSPAQTTAFYVQPVNTGTYQKKYYLHVNVNQFGYDLANVIKNDAGLYNVWNSLFGGTGGGTGDFDLIVDGDCLFQSTSACDYTFTLQNIPFNTTFALLSSITKGSTPQPLSYSFNLTNLTALQTYLNSLGLGTFTVTNPSGQTVIVTSTANSNGLDQLVYKIASSTYTAALTKNCTGYVPVKANFVIQQIINKICGLTDADLTTSQAYNICYLDNNGNVQVDTVAVGTSIPSLITELLQRNCSNITWLKGNSSINCANIKNAFPTSNLAITAADFALGTKGNGACAQVNYMDMFRYLLSAGRNVADVKQLFCEFVQLCATGLVCAPYNYINVYVSEYNALCTPIIGINYSIS